MVEDVVQKRIKVFKVCGFLAAVGLTYAFLDPFGFGLILTPVSFIGLLAAYVFLLRSNIRGSQLGVIGCGLAVLSSSGYFMILQINGGTLFIETWRFFVMILGIIPIAISIFKMVGVVRLSIRIVGLVGLASLVIYNLFWWIFSLVSYHLEWIDESTSFGIFSIADSFFHYFAILGVVFLVSCLYPYAVKWLRRLTLLFRMFDAANGSWLARGFWIWFFIGLLFMFIGTATMSGEGNGAFLFGVAILTEKGLATMLWTRAIFEIVWIVTFFCMGCLAIVQNGIKGFKRLFLGMVLGGVFAGVVWSVGAAVIGSNERQSSYQSSFD